MAVALRLAVRGWHVRVFENGASLGGKMNRWECDGFRFDTGPSLITMPWVFEELFVEAGERIADHLQIRQVNPLARYIFADGGQLEVDASLPRWLSTLREAQPQGDIQFLKMMRLGARLFELSRHTFFRRAPSEPPDWETFAALRHLPLRRAWGSYQKTVHSFFSSPRLRQVYERFPTYVGSSPARIPATLMLIPYLEHAFGAWHVVSGLYTIIERLREMGEKRGVRFLTGCRVTRIGTRSKRIEGVELADGSTHACSVAILNGDASILPALLGQSESASIPEKDRSLSGFVVLFGLSKRLTDAAHHTVCFSADYKKEFDELFSQRKFPEDPTVYVSIPSRDDPGLAPSGCETLFVMANAPANDSDLWDPGSVQAVKTSVMARLAKSGFPPFENDITVQNVVTPRQMAERYLMPGGAIYGTNSHGWRNAFFRPPNRHKKIGGLYFVGGSTHPGGGTPTVLLSAHIVSEMIRKYEGL
jgi:phytoene desaturase